MGIAERPARALVLPWFRHLSRSLTGDCLIVTARPETELGRVTTESQAGLLTPPEDAGALAQPIVHLAQDEDARRKMGLRARQFAEAWLGRDKIMAEWERLLYGLVNQAR